MKIVELYSKRMRRKNEGVNDVFQYDYLPDAFRVQVAHIWRDSIGTYKELWAEIQNTMCRELGLFELNEERNYSDQCVKYLLDSDINGAIDIIELSFKLIDAVIPELGYYASSDYDMTMSNEEAIEELNYRFREHGIGYEFINGEIIRVDSKYIHQESIKPAIKLLYEEEFDGSCNEFLKAHEHYRNKRYKEAIAESLKAFESTMKTICDKLSFSYDKNKDTSSKLLSILIENELVPDYLINHFSGLRTTLEAGLPTVRNKTSGHGQGANTVNIPDYFAAYAINLAAVNIVFLVNAFKSKIADY